MNENATTNGSGGNLMETTEVKELFTILKENGKDTAGLHTLLDYVSDMEFLVKRADDKIAVMESQLDAMKEIQDHPIKTALQNAIKALKANVAELKANIAELKSNIAEGCKNTAAAFKENGAAALNKLASFFKIKNGLQAIKKDVDQSVKNCDKAVAKIDTFSKEYHETGLHLKNMARVMIGKEPIDKAKESGKLAKAVSAPYKAEKACLLGIRKQVDKMIDSLDKLAQNVEANKNEKAAGKSKKPTLMERLDEKKKEIKERELEAPKKERALSKAGHEV